MEKNKLKSVLKKTYRFAFRIFSVAVLFFMGMSLIPLKSTVKPIQPRSNTQYWTLHDGYKIAYTKIEGDASNQRPPIIFLHGGPGGYIHSSIIKQMEVVAQAGYDVYLYDQIGSGLSDRLAKPKDYSFYRHVQDLEEIVTTQISAQKVILIGQSFGALIAAHFIADHAMLVGKVIFTSPAPLQPEELDAHGNLIDLETLYPTPESLHFKEPLDVFEETEKTLINPRIIVTNVSAMLFNIKWASDSEMDGLVNTMATRFTSGMVCDPTNVLPEEGGGGGYVHIFSNWYVGVEDPRLKLVDVNIPALVLQGQCDQNSYATAYEYADLLEGEYTFIEGAGHEIWWEQPEAFTSSILDFLMKADKE
ncbi:MAG: alpha/beta hydrolase fold protein [Chloroflexi bacterium OLB14]|nr:MAG: alpha/beta hydrolase fold protein [Chloroflexi bacterium OLB14]